MGVSAIARRVSLAICNGACHRGPLRCTHGRAVAPRDQDPPGDAANVILSAVGYNLRLVLAWLRMILRVVLLALLQAFAIRLYKPDF